MSTPDARALSTDLDLMRGIAATIDARSDEIRTMLAGFLGRMRSVPPTVWAGLAAGRFHDVMERWDAESATLIRALHGIADTVRDNERTLRDAAHHHSRRIVAAGENL